MNKVVCDVCGTSFPENATQCPICGFAHSTEPVFDGSDSNDHSYTYVKGGRFSKANVKKRAKGNTYAEIDGDSAEKTVAPQKGKKRSNAGMIIVIVILLIAILAVGGYIVLRFFVPNDYLYIGIEGFTLPSVSSDLKAEDTESTTETVSTEPHVVSCNAITLSHTDVSFEKVGDSLMLTATCDPQDTSEELVFTSNDTAVVTVATDGLIVAVGEGSAVITATCGSVQAQCNVTCLPVIETEPATAANTQPIMLNRKEITFHASGESWILYDGAVPLTDILWSSDDNTVATIIDGKVVAVGNGDTTVYGVYEGESVSCLIHCNFSEEDASGNGGISEAGGDAQRQYKLYNPYGNADDVTIKVDEEFTLKLVDENKNEITDAQWKIDPADCCSYTNGIVKGLKTGTVNVTATYEGVAYTCIVRVS